jgi:hypothetical protein
MNKVDVIFTQTIARDVFLFPTKLVDVCGIKFTLVTSNNVVNANPVLLLDCPEIRNFGNNSGYLADVPTDVAWIQPFPIPTVDNQLKSTTFHFSTREFKEIHLNLKPNNVSFGPGGYLIWKITFYCKNKEVMKEKLNEFFENIPDHLGPPTPKRQRSDDPYYNPFK